jgi:hypothetical protein
MEVLFWVGLSLVVGSIAGKYGRSSLGWFLLALLISPLLAMLFVLIAGKTLERKAAEAILLERMTERLHNGQPAIPPEQRVQYGPKDPVKAGIGFGVVMAVLVGLILMGSLSKTQSFLSSDFGTGTNKAAEPSDATEKWPWLKTQKMLEEETAQRACFDQNERTSGRKEDCSLPKVRERLNKGTTVAPTGAESESAAATKVPGAVRDKTTKAKQPASDPMQDALARQVLAMPGVSRW